MKYTKTHAAPEIFKINKGLKLKRKIIILARLLLKIFFFCISLTKAAVRYARAAIRYARFKKYQLIKAGNVKNYKNRYEVFDDKLFRESSIKGNKLINKYPSITTFRHVTIFDRTNLILFRNKIIHHDLYNFNLDTTSEELHNRISIDLKNKVIHFRILPKRRQLIAKAATFLDACSTNYSHWLTEVLPRVHLFCLNKSFTSIPIVIDDGLHENMLLSLQLVVNDRHEIITLPTDHSLKVKELYLTSPTGYVPFGKRTNQCATPIFNAFSLLSMRNHLKTKCKVSKPSAERIYIKRNSHYRRLINQSEIEEILKEHGFVTISPETLTFSEQVSLFSHAKIILGPTGATFANLIFCSQNTKIFIIASKHEDHFYSYWENMANAVGNKVNYILGSRVPSVHSDFTIDKQYLKSKIENILHSKNNTSQGEKL